MKSGFGAHRHQTAGVPVARDLRARKQASGAPRSDCAWRRTPPPSRDISSSSLNHRGPVRRRSELRMPHRLASDGPLCYAAGGSRFGCNGPACSAPSTTLSRRARLRKIIPRQVATISCMRLVNTPMAPATCSVWSESPGVCARDVLGRRAARPPFSSTCSKIALTGCSVASGPSAASLGLPDERRKASVEAFVVKNTEKKLFYRIRLS